MFSSQRLQNTPLRFTSLAASLVLSLLIARIMVPPIIAWLGLWFRLAPARPDILAFSTPENADFRSYLVTLFIVLTGVGVFLGLDFLFSKHKKMSTYFSVSIILAALIGAFTLSILLGIIAVALIGLLTLIFGAEFSDQASLKQKNSQSLTIAVASQSLSLLWGGWITSASLPSIAVVAVGTGTLIVLYDRIRHRHSASHASAGILLCFLPLVGLLRQPSVLWLITVVLGYYIVQWWLAPKLRDKPNERLIHFAICIGFWAVLAMLSIPYQFRDLFGFNHVDHEAGQLAWTNSIVHGKLMMADAGTLYGPLRQYCVALFAIVTGVTGEHVRLAQIWANLLSLAALTWIGWQASRRIGWLFIWFGFLILVGTPVECWMTYWNRVNFGWADLGRIVVPLTSVVLAARATINAWDGKKNQISRKLVLVGVSAGLAFLYAQEFGLCGILATLFIVFAHPVLRSERGEFYKRVNQALHQLIMALLGVVSVLLSFIGLYALLGKGSLLIKTFLVSVTLFGSGQYGAVPSPISIHSFDSWKNLTSLFSYNIFQCTTLEFLVPILIYLATLTLLFERAVRRMWSNQCTHLLAFLVFGVLTYKAALGRSDYYHLLVAQPAAVPLIVSLCAALVQGQGQGRIKHLAIVSSIFFLVLASFFCSSFSDSVWPRVIAMLNGKERPSQGPAYHYANIPRAGDVRLSAETVKMIEFIRQVTKPGDTIFNTRDFTYGSELLFLADRPNASRFDLTCEIATIAMRDEAFADVRKKKPMVIIGPLNSGIHGTEFSDYLMQNWQTVGTYEGIPVSLHK